ncbi:GMC family oxidoreductase [Nocardia brasiliensis]|uniref:GMC family oxidoreductase n=1 Tax=Nocardia brasiliensis TaxID=37326 RepID=UPI00378E1C80
MTSSTRFDTVIVGGGSAGAVVAARISEDPARRVLLVEAGPVYPSKGYPPEVASADVVGAGAGHDWGYATEPGYIGHPISALRGKLLGGSSAINASIAVRPLPSDFARWTARGLDGWTHADLLPWFKTLENTTADDDSGHGRVGPLPIHQHHRADITPMQQAFIDAAIGCGVQPTADFNGSSPIGVGAMPRNIDGNIRVNTAMAYLTAAVRARPNLRIYGDVLVDRVLFRGRRAVGLRLANGIEFHAGEVVLSAGAYGTPAILAALRHWACHRSIRARYPDHRWSSGRASPSGPSLLLQYLPRRPRSRRRNYARRRRYGRHREFAGRPRHRGPQHHPYPSVRPSERPHRRRHHHHCRHDAPRLRGDPDSAQPRSRRRTQNRPQPPR